MRTDLSERYQDTDVVQLMNKAAFFDPRFKTLAHLPGDTIDDISQSIQGEVVEILQRSNADDMDSPVVESAATEPPPKKKKKHPLKKVFGEKFGVASISGSVPLEDQAQAELARYKAESQSPLDHCSLKWWKEHCTIYPILSRICRKYLCLPSTSVPLESLFSVVGIIVNEKRAALDPHNVDKIIFLHDNSEPIYLDYQRLKKKCKCDACLASESD